MIEAKKDLPDGSRIYMELEDEQKCFFFRIRTGKHTVHSESFDAPSFYDVVPKLQKAVDLMRVKHGLQPKTPIRVFNNESPA